VLDKCSADGNKAMDIKQNKNMGKYMYSKMARIFREDGKF
jgi:hypothetical protein